MLLKNVRCEWASVIEPNTRFEPQWEIVALLDDQQAAELAAEGLKIKVKDDGQKTYRFKRKTQGRKKTGETYDKKAPRVVDASRDPFSELIGNGSLVNIQYAVTEWPMHGQMVISADLEGVQVIEHVPFKKAGGSINEFEDEGSTSTIQGKEAASEQPDDDIPF